MVSGHCSFSFLEVYMYTILLGLTASIVNISHLLLTSGRLIRAVSITMIDNLERRYKRSYINFLFNSKVPGGGEFILKFMDQNT
jgi:hypothetical protein